MKWSLRIGRVARIELRIHVTLAILLAWLALTRWQIGPGIPDVIAGMTLMFVFLGLVLLHELGHALAAHLLGIRTLEITLLPVGGMSVLEDLAGGRREILIALSGPAVNLLLAGGLAVLARFDADPLPAQMAWISFALALVNLLPAFPLDGGRAVRALLERRLGRLRASDVSAYVGRGLAVVVAVVGLLVDPFLTLVALFLWIASTQEARRVRVTLLRGGDRNAPC